jgi:predicted kinase
MHAGVAIQSHVVHVVCGSTGAGKTTYSCRLSDRLGAVRFSIDEWMSALFWMDTPKPLQAASLERVERCFSQIWSVASQVARRGVPCVLDVGFGDAKNRQRIYNLVTDAGLSMQLHFLNVPVAERWHRVQIRNAEKGASYQLPFDVTREMFDFCGTLWEPPSDEEMRAYNGIRV